MKFISAFIIFILIGAMIYAQVPLNWTRDEINPGEDFTITPDDSFLTDGTKSCHLQLNSGAAPYLFSEVYYVTPGAAYEFSFDVFDHDTAGQVKVYADFYDTYGFDIFGQPPAFSTDSSEWQTVSWSGIIPAQAVVGYVLIKFYNQPDLYHFTKTAHIWIDHVQFRQAEGNNLVVNGGFEDWIVGIDEWGNERKLLSVYPNPAGDFVNFDLPADSKVIVISDLTGREVKRFITVGKELLQVDVKYLPAGLYLITAIHGDDSILTHKLVVK